MTVNELVKKSHERAKKSGWWNPAKSSLECHMMVVTELAEAVEACRTDQPPIWYNGEKPEGECIELVDAIIRIADYFGYKGWNLEEALRIKMEYNKTRPHRHGDKKF